MRCFEFRVEGLGFRVEREIANGKDFVYKIHKIGGL